MAGDLGAMNLRPKRGGEQFHQCGQSLGFHLQGFWSWAASDLVSNTWRGVLAEYLVARALEIRTDAKVRDAWGACDLLYKGRQIQVKSAAYLQSWHQDAESKISFSISPKRPWSRETNKTGIAPVRTLDLYVFALLAHRDDKNTLDPMDVGQWSFFVVPLKVIEGYKRSRHSITRPSLEKTLKIQAVPFSGLKAEVDHCLGKP